MSPAKQKLWAALKEPFLPEQIEKLPKGLFRGADKGPCNVPDRNGYMCGGYHQMPAIHLDYVGHAGVTQRLNDVDPTWTWEPMTKDVDPDLMQQAIATGNADIVRMLLDNAPMRFSQGGLWIKLTVLGVTRPGFGDPGQNSGPNGTKEIIGDAIRNAAMRFGVATYLWSKSEAAQALLMRELGAEPDADAPAEAPRAPRAGRPARPPAQRKPPEQTPATNPGPPAPASEYAGRLAEAATDEELGRIWAEAQRYPSLPNADVHGHLTDMQRSVAGLEDATSLPLGRWAFACREHFLKSGDSIKTAADLAAANQ
jgi:hypothetical protein